MLVLKRKLGESVMLGEHIQVQVISVEGDSVKLGFTAPAHIQILRKELVDSILQENMNAGKQWVDRDQLLNILKQFNRDEGV